LYVREDDRPKFEEALFAAPLPPEANGRLALTIERRRGAFKRALVGGCPKAIVAAAKEAARDLLQVVDHHDFAVQKALALLEHDRCTFQHSCNVSLYSAALSKRLGMSDADVEQVIVGAMVHDVGKRHIPTYILRKAGLLEDRERALIRQHPVTGFRELVSLGELNRRQLMMVYQHHERIDGTGYPVGIPGDEIDPWGKICAVADVFEALTANRPYRGASTAAEALTTMHGEKGHFDADLLRLWTEVVR
jgi:putative nucleotidyltransferase with HDIG domain